MDNVQSIELTPEQRKFIRDWYPANNWGENMEILYQKVVMQFNVSTEEAKKLVREFDSK